MKLSDDEVRERFSAFHDGELPEPEAAFVRARLDADKALAAEYEAFTRMLGGLAGLGIESEGTMKPGVVPADVQGVDLLAGVQAKLYKRSKGRFYRDRYSRVAGIVPLEAFAVAVLLILAIAYVCMTYISNLHPAAEGNTGQNAQPR